jgi:hypothetical protein
MALCQNIAAYGSNTSNSFDCSEQSLCPYNTLREAGNFVLPFKFVFFLHTVLLWPSPNLMAFDCSNCCQTPEEAGALCGCIVSVLRSRKSLGFKSIPILIVSDLSSLQPELAGYMIESANGLVDQFIFEQDFF